MKVAIVIVSYKPDLHWLSYCLRFLHRNWKEPGTEIVVRVEPDCREIVETWRVPQVRYEYVEPWPDGYAFQMYCKMTADFYTNADLIILVDSDLMLFHPVFLDDILVDGKIPIDWLPWNESQIAEQAWRACTSKIMGMDLDNDYMVSAPFPVWRRTFGEVRDRIEKVNQKPFEVAIFSDVPFTTAGFNSHPLRLADYEALYLWAAKTDPGGYILRNCHDRPQPWPWRLYWSRGDWSPELQAGFDRLLTSQ
jgi:hypothetical protein